MDVEDPPAERAQRHRADQAQEAGQDHHIGAGFGQKLRHSLVEEGGVTLFD
jgi:hypothetical protein